MLEVDIICGTWQTRSKKAQGYKNEHKFVYHFWFCAICRLTKSCLILKFISPKTISKILSFEGISVFISQKLRKLEQNNICRFFSPSRYTKRMLFNYLRTHTNHFFLIHKTNTVKRKSFPFVSLGGVEKSKIGFFNFFQKLCRIKKML